MDKEQAAKLSKVMMARQLKLSLRVAAIFILVLIGLPLLNLYAPQVAATNVGGFTLTWLVLGVLFYPLTWVLSQWYVKDSERIEEELAKQGDAK